MLRALLLAGLCASPAAAGEATWQIAAATSALVGAETVVVYKPSVSAGARLVADVLSSGTTEFAVVKAEARGDGTWVWTIIALAEGPRRFSARWTLDAAPVAAPDIVVNAEVPAIENDADILDIKAPLAARRALWPWLLAAALGAFAWEAWRRWKARKTLLPKQAAAQTPPPPADVAAESALAALESSGAWASGQYAFFYLRLTEILRVYLESRWGEPATAMTTPEVARLIKNRHSDIRLAARGRELLQRADLIKFARIKPADADGAADIQIVREIVRATTPADLVAAAEAA